jgi:hypothetical protein
MCRWKERRFLSGLGENPSPHDQTNNNERVAV